MKLKPIRLTSIYTLLILLYCLNSSVYGADSAKTNSGTATLTSNGRYMEVWPLELTKRAYQIRIPAVKSQYNTITLDVRITDEQNHTVRNTRTKAIWENVVWPQSIWEMSGLPVDHQVRGAWIAEVPIAQDKPGERNFIAKVVTPQVIKGQNYIARNVVLHGRPGWINQKAGLQGIDSLPKSWTPMTLYREDKKIDIGCWNRSTTLTADGAFINQIVRGKDDILTSPMQLIISDADGNQLKPFGKWQVVMESISKVMTRRKLANITSQAQITLTQEYDGFTRVNIDFKGGRGIGIVEVIVPLQATLAQYIYYYPDNPWYWGNIKNVIPVPREGLGWTASYRDYLFIGDVSGGLYWWSGDRKQWQKPNDPDTVQVLSNGKTVEARFVLHKEPEQINSAKYEFGIQVTPVKPWPTDPLHNRVSLFNWDESIVNSLDRLQEVGYKVIGLCEWWTTAWGGTTPRDPIALKHLTTEAHKRGMQVIVYFGFELDETLNDFVKYPWELLGTDPRLAPVNSGKAVSRFYPPERFDSSLPDRKVYGNQRTGAEKERLLAGMKTLLTAYGVDGFYLDGTQLPTGSLNEGRELMKRMRYLVDTYATRGIIYAHTSSRNDIAVNGFADVVSNGEQLAAVPELSGWKDDIGVLPMDYILMLLNPQPWGVPHDIVDVLGPEYSDLAKLLGTGCSNYQWSENQWPMRKIWIDADLWHAQFTPFDVATTRWDKRPNNVYFSYYRSSDNLYTIILYNANLVIQDVSFIVRDVLNLTASQKLDEPCVIYAQSEVKWKAVGETWHGNIPACRAVILQTKVSQ